MLEMYSFIYPPTHTRTPYIIWAVSIIFISLPLCVIYAYMYLATVDSRKPLVIFVADAVDVISTQVSNYN